MELVDLEAARLEALAALGEIAKDQLRDGDHRDFVIDIREGAGPVVLTVSLSLRVNGRLSIRPDGHAPAFWVVRSRPLACHC